MARWGWWFIRGIIYSGIVFAFLYLFIHLGAIPDLSEQYVKSFTMTNTIIVSVICGFVFVSINDAFFGKRKNKERGRR